jgi:hypothetical protein
MSFRHQHLKIVYLIEAEIGEIDTHLQYIGSGNLIFLTHFAKEVYQNKKRCFEIITCMDVL